MNFRYYVAVAQRFNLLFLLHFLIFYLQKVRIVNDKTKSTLENALEEAIEKLKPKRKKLQRKSSNSIKN